MRDQYVFVMAKSQSFIGFLLSISISGDSASYFIQMSLLISFEYTLAQTRMVFSKVTLPSKGPMRGKYVFTYSKIPKFLKWIFYFQLVFVEVQPLFAWNDYAY